MRKILLIIILLTSPAQADYHYASREGSNEYPYTSWETAANLIQDAVDAASAHDTVYIGAGEYYELIRVPDSTTYLGLIGMGSDSTYIWTDAPGGNNLMRPAPYTIIDGIHFEHFGVNSCIHASFQDHMTVKNCLFNRPEHPAGAISSLDGNMTVENCVFYSDDGSISNLPYGTQNVRISNCYFEDRGTCMLVCGTKVIVENNIGSSELSGFFDQAGAIDTLIIRNNISHDCNVAYLTSLPPDSSVFDNNTSINDSKNNPGRNKPACYFFNTYNANIYNNIIIGVGMGIWLRDALPDSWYDLRFNNLVNGDEDIRVEYDVIDTSVIYHEFPMFVGNDDYHLQAFSPLIDAGNPDILDVDGSISDIGAFGGPGGESYEYQDLQPLLPDSISFYTVQDTIFFNWRMNEEADFNRYEVYRDTISGFEPSVFNLVGEPETSQFIDTDTEPGQTYYYRFASIDNQDNRSDYSDEIEVIMTGIHDNWGAELPSITTIQSNYPNPFNSETIIEYSVANVGPIPAQIDIEIYDILGRKVRVLVSQQINLGIHRVTWDSRDDSGAECPTGVYFARISQWGFSMMTRPRKVTIMK